MEMNVYVMKIGGKVVNNPHPKGQDLSKSPAVAGFFVYRHLGLMGCNIGYMKLLFIILPFLILISCQDDNSETENHEYRFEVEYENTGISKDNNDYFHLTLDRNNWQTLYRVRGIVYKDDEPSENIKFYWDSNLYWIIGDTLG